MAWQPPRPCQLLWCQHCQGQPPPDEAVGCGFASGRADVRGRITSNTQLSDVSSTSDVAEGNLSNEGNRAAAQSRDSTLPVEWPQAAPQLQGAEPHTIESPAATTIDKQDSCTEPVGDIAEGCFQDTSKAGSEAGVDSRTSSGTPTPEQEPQEASTQGKGKCKPDLPSGSTQQIPFSQVKKCSAKPSRRNKRVTPKAVLEFGVVMTPLVAQLPRPPEAVLDAVQGPQEDVGAISQGHTLTLASPMPADCDPSPPPAACFCPMLPLASAMPADPSGPPADALPITLGGSCQEVSKYGNPRWDDLLDAPVAPELPQVSRFQIVDALVASQPQLTQDFFARMDEDVLRVLFLQI